VADRGARGVTFLELMATATILIILVRQRELELRRALRTMRTAVDRYKLAVDKGQIGGPDVKLGSEGYPPDLEVLVKGVNRVGAVDRKLKFLRSIPRDPMTRSAEWGMRCYQDEHDDSSWCGQNVYDVYSKSKGKALDGTTYDTW